MSTSQARMERRLSRSREQKRTGGLLQSSLSRALVSMASDHAAGRSRKLDVAGLLSHDGFDDALIAATPRILDQYTSGTLAGFHQSVTRSPSGFDMPSFVQRLTDEAAHMEFAGTLPNGANVTIRANLFAMPIVGWMDRMSAFIPAPTNMATLARSFRDSGLVGKGASIILSPTLLDLETSADILPGAVRILTQILQVPLTDPDFELGEVMSAFLEVPATAAELCATDFLCHRLMTGVRVQVAPKGERFDDDFFASSDKDETALGAWRSRLASLLPSGLQVLAPLPFTRARSALALETIVGHLALDAHEAGISLPEMFDRLWVQEAPGEVVVTGELGGRKLGPVSVPALAAFSDVQWFAEQMFQLSHSIVGTERKATHLGPSQ